MTFTHDNNRPERHHASEERQQLESTSRGERAHGRSVDEAWGPGAKVAKAETQNSPHLPTFETPATRPGAGSGTEAGAGKDSFQSKPIQGAENEQKAMQHLIGDGLTPQQAAGVVGNLVQESGTDPGKKQIGGGPGFGLAQWGGSRLDNLNKFAKEQGKPVNDLNTQLDFISHELQTSEKGALNSLKKTDTASSAALAFEKGFERAGKPNNENRARQADRVLAQYFHNDSPTVQFAGQTLNQPLA